MKSTMKTIVRLMITLPESTGTIQRLYDMGWYFKLEEEAITDADKLTNFLKALQAKGEKQIYSNTYISDDDFKEHQLLVYEYITD